MLHYDSLAFTKFSLVQRKIQLKNDIVSNIFSQQSPFLDTISFIHSEKATCSSTSKNPVGIKDLITLSPSLPRLPLLIAMEDEDFSLGS